MTARPDDAALAAELEAVREASRAGEIVAVDPEAERSMARYVAGASLRLVLFFVVIAVVSVLAAALGR